MTVVLRRNGEDKLRFPAVIHADGTIWSKAEQPVINSTGTGFDKEKILVLMNARKYSEIPSTCFVRMGENEGGLLAVDADVEYKNRIINMSPAQKERNRIEALYAKARRIANSDSEDNVWLPMSIESEADAALARWCTDYPEEAKAEKKADMLAEAEHQEELAAGALVFDMDGSLSPADQQARHDEFMAKAKRIRDAANSL